MVRDTVSPSDSIYWFRVLDRLHIFPSQITLLGTVEDSSPSTLRLIYMLLSIARHGRNYVTQRPRLPCYRSVPGARHGVEKLDCFARFLGHGLVYSCSDFDKVTL